MTRLYRWLKCLKHVLLFIYLCIYISINAWNKQTLHSSVKVSGCESSWSVRLAENTLQIFPLITKHKVSNHTQRPSQRDRQSCTRRPTTAVTHRDAEVEEDEERFLLHMREADIHWPQALCSRSESQIRCKPQAVQQGFQLQYRQSRQNRKPHLMYKITKCLWIYTWSSIYKQFIRSIKWFLQLDHCDCARFSLENQKQRIAERKTSSPNTHSTSTSIC